MASAPSVWAPLLRHNCAVLAARAHQCALDETVARVAERMPGASALTRLVALAAGQAVAVPTSPPGGTSGAVGFGSEVEQEAVCDVALTLRELIAANTDATGAEGESEARATVSLFYAVMWGLRSLMTRPFAVALMGQQYSDSPRDPLSNKALEAVCSAVQGVAAAGEPVDSLFEWAMLVLGDPVLESLPLVQPLAGAVVGWVRQLWCVFGPRCDVLGRQALAGLVARAVDGAAGVALLPPGNSGVRAGRFPALESHWDPVLQLVVVAFGVMGGVAGRVGDWAWFLHSLDAVGSAGGGAGHELPRCEIVTGLLLAACTHPKWRSVAVPAVCFALAGCVDRVTAAVDNELAEWVRERECASGTLPKHALDFCMEVGAVTEVVTACAQLARDHPGCKVLALKHFVVGLVEWVCAQDPGTVHNEYGEPVVRHAPLEVPDAPGDNSYLDSLFAPKKADEGCVEDTPTGMSLARLKHVLECCGDSTRSVHCLVAVRDVLGLWNSSWVRPMPPWVAELAP